MTSAWRIATFVMRDVARSKWAIIAGVFYFLVTEGLFRFSGDNVGAIVSLTNITLITAPLISLVFGAMYLYSSREFIELLLTQPVERGSIYTGLFLGLATPLTLGYLIGVGAPFVMHVFWQSVGWGPTLTALATGAALSVISAALAFVIAVFVQDKSRGLGAAILVWLFLTVLYDALILLVVFAFDNYPLETPMIAMILLNPVDLARIATLLQVDSAALMGYTGAVFQRFFSGNLGVALAGSALVLWAVIPFWIGVRRFRRKDFS